MQAMGQLPVDLFYDPGGNRAFALVVPIAFGTLFFPSPGIIVLNLLAEFPGINGFLGGRASLMVDVVFLAMFAVLPILGWSVWQVKSRRRFALHKRVQLTLAAVLLVAVTAFEIDMRFISGWRSRAEPSPYWASGVVTISLCIHLVFSISTAVLWLYVVIGALRNIPKPPAPSPYSPRHIFWARLAAIDMTLTAITGWIFYWLAFVAR